MTGSFVGGERAVKKKKIFWLLVAKDLFDIWIFRICPLVCGAFGCGLWR
jgi:hypothetical protein